MSDIEALDRLARAILAGLRPEVAAALSRAATRMADVKAQIDIFEEVALRQQLGQQLAPNPEVMRVLDKDHTRQATLAAGIEAVKVRAAELEAAMSSNGDEDFDGTSFPSIPNVAERANDDGVAATRIRALMPGEQLTIRNVDGRLSFEYAKI